MKKNIFKISIAIVALSTPHLSMAAGKTLKDVIATVIGYFQVFISLIIGLAVVTFVWNIYRYFFTDKEKKEAGMYVLYSTVGFFVILSIWGLVNILTSSLNLDTRAPVWPFGERNSSQQRDTDTFAPPPARGSRSEPA